ncbi:hypothetical protein [Mycobacterium deserti]|uniref:Uncharacterized protein n=1 Tax=Mycobacterium deserti TaxID=2978347 RepID=A0ABT2MF03_9MYCO|nr:hypothetical protein [Mycobacterium deserti]MCT7660860.1 hypothetical protein [Mycobacterium deserti]
MRDSEQLPDEVPVADAVEQSQDTSVPDDEAAAQRPQTPPLEAAPADWQEQLETVDLDPEERRDHD